MEKTINKLNSVSYTGNVKIELFNGKRKLQQYCTHNTGKQRLFDFLANCLVGNFNAAKSAMPCRVACFNNEDKLVSKYVYYDSAAVDRTTNGKDGTLVIYRFRIPYTCLIAGGTIKKVALYSNNDQQNKYAEDEIPEIPIPSSGGNFTIAIEWTMTITNGSKN